MVSISKDSTIREVFKNIDFSNIPLQDDETPNGGLAHEGETLGEFMQACNIDIDDNFIILQQTLKLNGIMPLNILELIR